MSPIPHPFSPLPPASVVAAAYDLAVSTAATLGPMWAWGVTSVRVANRITVDIHIDAAPSVAVLVLDQLEVDGWTVRPVIHFDSVPASSSDYSEPRL